MNTIIELVSLIITTGIYFLPSIIVYKRKNRPFLPFFLINLFLGLTVIAWIIQLIISVKKEKPVTQQSTVTNTAKVETHAADLNQGQKSMKTENGTKKNVELIWPLDIIYAKSGWSGVVGGVAAILIVGFLVMKSFDAVSDQASGKSGSFVEWATDDQKSTEQYKFEKSLSEILDEYKRGENEIQKSASYTKFAEHLKNYVAQNGVLAKGWISTVEALSTNRGGESADLRLKSIFSVSDNAYNLFFDASYSHLDIPKGSPEYNLISNLKEGAKVRVNFKFTMNRKGEIVRGMHPSEQFGIASPNFIVEIVNIEKL